MSIARDLYEKGVDFSALALQDHDFGKVLKANGQLDFTDPASIKQLTKSLLKRDFGLDIDLPNDRLCPPVPNRLNYILWLQDLLDTTSKSLDDRYHEDREVTGLDIGTGSSCIYPLLGCSCRLEWKFVATDIDSKNIQYARQNVLLNGLGGRIRPVQVSADEPLMQLDKFGLKSIDFTMCNPPFYASASELVELAKAKSRPPHSACTGAELEMVTTGGEVAFVQRMIDESVGLGKRVQWYSTMLGRLCSVEQLVPVLEERGNCNWAVTEFVQGSKTRRWGLAWSWSGSRPPSAFSRNGRALSKALMPFPPEHTINLADRKTDVTEEQINTLMESLDIRWRYKPAIRQGVGFAKGNVWSRAARRRKASDANVGAAPISSKSDEDSEPALGFKVTLDDQGPGTTLQVRWLVGLDSVLYESFCGMLRRKLAV